jgi:protein tyrosine phosphatase (PTP) superfamily phosphohydrolase (DUF442 family)
MFARLSVVSLPRQFVGLSGGILLCGAMLASAVAQTSLPNASAQPNSECSPSLTTTQAQSSSGPHRLDSTHLPNLVWIHARVLSGGQPEGEAAYRELAELGVKTIITVDGAQPDVETAKRFGLRYVHLPHGYDGIPEDRVAELAKAVLELDGPIYIHCHHGKHRSPAAASVACVSSGLIPAEQAVEVLKVAGTSSNYRGLFRAAAQAKPIPTKTLHARHVDFRERSEIPPLAEAMIQLEQMCDRFDQISKAGWRAPENHVDLDLAHEALLLREQFAELLRTQQSQQQADEFLELLQDSQQAAIALENALRVWKPSPGMQPPVAFDQHFSRITENCRACHVKFRDNVDRAR